LTTLFNIALPIPGNKLYTYAIEHDDSAESYIGRRVFVSFGRKTSTGFVIEIREDKPDFAVKTVEEVLDEKPIFNANMLKFCKWTADYYKSSLGEVLKTALPQGILPESMIRITLKKHISTETMLLLHKKNSKKADLISIIKSLEGKETTPARLAKRIGSASVSTLLDALINDEIIECEPVRSKETTSKTALILLPHSKRLKTADDFSASYLSLQIKSQKQAKLLKYVWDNTINGIGTLQSSALTATECNHSHVQALLKKELVERQQGTIDRNANKEETESLAKKDESKLRLTTEQSEVCQVIARAITTAAFHPFLLHGVTGSGKTLIYIQAIQEAIRINRKVLILVPEISLTPQLIDRFKLVFGDNIAVTHSGLSGGERYDTWRKILRDEVKIVLGVRSAIFAPINNLGLIIVDEEHENTYKQDSKNPRYNARDLAVVRARIDNAVLVLGSATPSLESYYNAKSGKYTLLEIKSRADGAKLPFIDIVDMISARQNKKVNGVFSEYLLNEIESRLKNKEGIILFQNRRGYSNMLECFDCGHVPYCKNCDLPLTFHKPKNQLRCHYCGHTIYVPSSCEICGSKKIEEIGSGTQKIEEELYTLLKEKGIEVKIARMDLDTTSKKGAHRKMLTDFSSGKTDILIGTQMVAKGLDFDRVSLVGIVNADSQLLIPDFRSSERTYQLLTQVAGRAGRGGKIRGKVIIQSTHPNYPAIKITANGNYLEFYQEEIQKRKDACYPPFHRFITIEFSGTEAGKVFELSKKYSSLLPRNTKYFEVLGPNEAQLFRIRNKYRYITVIKSNKEYDPSGKYLMHYIAAADSIFEKEKNKGDFTLKVDIDSYSSI
jgi:primosomal protein N' (replication factor Y)